MPIKELADLYDSSESQTKSLLFRVRNALKTYLEKEGITI
jgi:DNA-directed RNA polymerase specialized sigma24 family protein